MRRRVDLSQTPIATAGYSAFMRPPRRHRRWISAWLVALLLLVQWATAAYACPRWAASVPDSAPPPAMASMPDCSGAMSAMDAEQPQLCKSHCDLGQQSVHSGSTALDVPPAMALGGVLQGVLRPADVAGRAATPPSMRCAGPPVGTPPLYLSLLVLRN